MTETSSFKVYNASAGSGKTFTLVKEYLKLLFVSNQPHFYRNILALTFTNKAVGEMKYRIIETLKEFSDDAILTKPSSLFTVIVDELNDDPKAIHNASKKILNRILHNYASFDISTIDRFTHKVIRTFAFDLKIPVNFEVELDTDSLLSEAVDNLIAKAGTDKELTKILVDFAIEKADDDKSWDISFDFNKIAKLLVNDNDIPFLKFLNDKTLQDFKGLKILLKTKLETNEKSIVNKAKKILTLIEKAGLQFNDFNRGFLPKHFINLSNSKFDIKFENKWQTELEDVNLYPKRVSDDVASTIESLKPQLIGAFKETKQQVFQQLFYKNFYKSITPLSVLNAINTELKIIKEDNNLLLISEFNKIINTEIKDQPTPFIYERLGEKFRHYFIDEFQDTSEMQWNNLIPLIDNRIASEEGSAMIVGDAKQAIYRWRGGDAKIFMGLYNKASNPFIIKQDVVSLDFNYRSCKRVVEFNNTFFNHLSNFAFADENHSTLFTSAKQKEHLKEEGYVNIEFLDFDEIDDKDKLYPEAVKQRIEQSQENGFELRDICVLVRKKRQGVAIANYLSEQNIDIISSETLLINRSPKVRFIADILKLSVQPENKELKASILYFISESHSVENAHNFIKNGANASLNELSDTLKSIDILFGFNLLSQLSLYDAAEYIVRAFNLVETSDAYIQFYLDTVLDYAQKQSSNILEFLAYWDAKKDKLSITIPEGKDAVQIMTIHKSKGLEFPVVIFPYADLNIYKELEPKIWFPLKHKEFNGFSYALLNFNKNLAQLNEHGEQLYNEHQSALELDNINILYVALTRAVEQLYIISKKDFDKTGNEKLNEYSGLLINYLKTIGKWSDASNYYSFGNPKKQLNHSTNFQNTFISKEFTTNKNNIKIVTNSGLLWDTKQKEAIEKGNLTHDLMSKIKTPKDVDFVLNESLFNGIIDINQKTLLQKSIQSIIQHPKLKNYYTDDVHIYNERDIISSNGTILRPDRLVLDKKNNATIIDYKTGEYDKKHMQQLITYADVIETMNIKINKKILVYINDEITVEEI